MTNWAGYGIILLSYGGIAQLGERLNGIQEVRGSTPLISIPEGRAAKLGLSKVKNYSNPTTIEFVRCAGCSIPEGRAAKRGLSKVKNYSDPTTIEFVLCVGCSTKRLNSFV